MRLYLKIIFVFSFIVSVFSLAIYQTKYNALNELALNSSHSKQLKRRTDIKLDFSELELKSNAADIELARRSRENYFSMSAMDNSYEDVDTKKIRIYNILFLIFTSMFGISLLLYFLIAKFNIDKKLKLYIKKKTGQPINLFDVEAVLKK